MHPIAWLLSILGVNIIGEQVYNEIKKITITKDAYRYARQRGKPVLDFGCGFRPKGDYNVDIKLRIAKNFVQIRSFERPRLPFSRKFFASALALHVLEHTFNPENALKELRRVAERVYVLTPRSLWILAWLHSQHKWIFTNNEVYFPNPLYHTKEDIADIPILYPEREAYPEA